MLFRDFDDVDVILKQIKLSHLSDSPITRQMEDIRKKPHVQKVTCFFMSTYTYESTMDTIKRKQRNRLTHAHLECLTVISTTNYKYHMKKVKDVNASYLFPVLSYIWS